MLYALYDFPKPNDLTSAWSWFGLINQVAWAYSFSTVMQPFRDLIRPNQKFYWDDSLGKLSESSKLVVIDLVKEGVQSFDQLAKHAFRQTGVSMVLVTLFCRNTVIALQNFQYAVRKDGN